MRIWTPNTPRKPLQQQQQQKQQQKQPQKQQYRRKVSSSLSSNNKKPQQEKFVVVNKVETIVRGNNHHSKNNLNNSHSDDSTAGSSTCSAEFENSSNNNNNKNNSNNNNNVVTNNSSSPPKRVLGGRILSNPYLRDASAAAASHSPVKASVQQQQPQPPQPFPRRSLRSVTTTTTTTKSTITKASTTSPEDQRQQVLETSKKLLQTRGFSIRKQLLELLQEESARLLQAQVRGWLQRTHYQEQVAAAKFIQLYYRAAILHRQKTEEWREGLMEAYLDYYSYTRVGASIMLQSLVRGGLVRLALQKQHEAATVIQSAHYCWSKGLRVVPSTTKKSQKSSQWNKVVAKGVIEFQAAWRGMTTRNRLLEGEYDEVAAPNKAVVVVCPAPLPPGTTIRRRGSLNQLPLPPPIMEDCDTPVHANKFMKKASSLIEQQEDTCSSSSSSESEEEHHLHHVLVAVQGGPEDEVEVHEVDSDEDDEDFDDDDSEFDDLDDELTYEDDLGDELTYEDGEAHEVPVEVLEKLEQEEAQNRGGWFNELVMDMVCDFEDTWKEMTVTDPKMLEA